MWTSGKATVNRIMQGQIVHNGDLSLSGNVMQLPGIVHILDWPENWLHIGILDLSELLVYA